MLRPPLEPEQPAVECCSVHHARTFIQKVVAARVAPGASHARLIVALGHRGAMLICSIKSRADALANLPPGKVALPKGVMWPTGKQAGPSGVHSPAESRH